MESIRYSFATHLLEGNVDVLTFRKLRGHSSLSSTSIYVYVRQERLAYLCRYTHRVAISNNRIKSLDGKKGIVTFRY